MEEILQIFFYFRKVGISAHEILALLDKTDIPKVRQMVVVPDGNELHSDEDSGEEEDEPMDVNHLGKGILNNMAEIDIEDNEDELPDIQVFGSRK